MWTYHLHYSLHQGVFTESTSVGWGWYGLILMVMVGIGLAQVVFRRK